ncbi:MAG TPA: MFS transporter [Dehalococcoidia bacterium]|nr:MFS transporter [Dehalococcoidia bacterium]
MTEDQGRHRPLAPLGHPAFVFYAGQRFFGGTAMTLLQASMAWQVNLLSGDTREAALNLGLLGLLRFFPAFGLSLLGGAVADTYNRRNIVRAAQTLPLACAVVLTMATAGGWTSLALIFGLVVVVAVGSSFENPAGASLLPSLVPPDEFTQAVSISNSMRTLGFLTGPTVAGVIIELGGMEAAYLAHVALIACSLTLVSLVSYRPQAGPRRAVSMQGIIEGVNFVRRQVLVGAMALDMFAVILGGATALLPIYATDILDVGALGYGVLQGSFEMGAFLMAVGLLVRPPIVNTGRALLITVALFGAGTIVFGLSRWFPLSLAAYTFIGMADQLSVVLRQTTIQLSTPDELRGRVSAVSQVFIGASNQLGALESGLVAAATNATIAVVSGGAGCIAVVGIVAVKLPELRRYRIGAPPPALRDAEREAIASAEPAGD